MILETQKQNKEEMHPGNPYRGFPTREEIFRMKWIHCASIGKKIHMYICDQGIRLKKM